MSLKIVKCVFGPLMTNCFVIQGKKECWIVDPGMQPDGLADVVNKNDLTCTKILLTHGHGDHIGGVKEIKEAFPDAKICCPKNDTNMLTDPMMNLSGQFGLGVTSPQQDEIIEPGTDLEIEGVIWKTLDTSGHTPGGVSFYCESQKIVITGDALFAGSIGRTDIPGANHEQLINNIKNNILTLPDDTQVLSGHGPETTVAAEKVSNPFVGS